MKLSIKTKPWSFNYVIKTTDNDVTNLSNITKERRWRHWRLAVVNVRFSLRRSMNQCNSVLLDHQLVSNKQWVNFEISENKTKITIHHLCTTANWCMTKTLRSWMVESVKLHTEKQTVPITLEIYCADKLGIDQSISVKSRRRHNDQSLDVLFARETGVATGYISGSELLFSCIGLDNNIENI